MSDNLPAGLVTFLFTDIEASTQLWERHPEGMRRALARHDAILQTAVEAHNGRIIKTTGDGAYAVFAGAAAGLQAAADAQRALSQELWPDITPDAIRARMGIHSGEAELRDGDYFGPALNLTARLMAAGHGGQILVSPASAALAQPATGFDLRQLGRYRLKGIAEPQVVLQLLAAGLPANFPALNAPNTAVRNLPGQTTPFVGRRREVAELQQLIIKGNGRLLTLLGPGGIGKTRTAIEVARAIAEAGEPFRDGAVFVPLAAVDSSGDIARTVAGALDFVFGGEHPPERQLASYLSDKRLLLLLDNLEQLLGQGIAHFVETMLAAAPDVKILATSRERLNLRGETVYALSGLGERAADGSKAMDGAALSDRLQLFVQSAARAVPGFTLGEDNIHAVERIVDLTEGMPLGIELAAGWLSVLSPAEIAHELTGNLDLLETNMRDVPERQRSLRAVFEGSWRQLSAREQDAFLRLSVFRGGFGRPEAEAVAGVSLPVLLLLVNKSFLQRREDGYFALHELLRYFAGERLRADPEAWTAARQAHARAYADFLALLLPRLRGAQQFAALEDIDREFDNIRLAWDWFEAQGAFADLSSDMVPALFHYATLRMRYAEVMPALQKALDSLRMQPGGAETLPCLVLQTAVIDLAVQQYISPPFPYPDGRAILTALEPVAAATKAEAGIWYTLFLKHHLLNMDDLEILTPWLEQHMLLRQQGDAWTLAFSTRTYWEAIALAGHMQDCGDPLPGLEEALRLFQSLGDTFETAVTLAYGGWMTGWQGHFLDAIERLDQAQRLLIGQGAEVQRAPILHELSDLSFKSGQPQRGFQFLAERAALQRRLNRKDLLSASLHWESIYALRYSDLDHAFRTRRESSALAENLAAMDDDPVQGAIRFDVDWNLFELSEIYRVAGDLEQARANLARAEAIFRTRGVLGEMGLAYCQRVRADIAFLEGRTDEAIALNEAFIAWARAAGRTHFEVALGLTGLGRALARAGRFEESERAIREALALSDVPLTLTLTPWPVEALAELHAARGQTTTAAQLAAYVLREPLSWREVRAAAAALMEAIRPSLPADFDEAAAAHAAAQTLLPALGLTFLPSVAWAGRGVGRGAEGGADND